MTKKPENYSDFNVRHKDIICNFAVSYTYPLTYYIKDSIVMKDIRLSRKKSSSRCSCSWWWLWLAWWDGSSSLPLPTR